MEAFSLLKYWRGGGGGATVLPSTTATPTPRSSSTVPTTTIVASVTDEDDDGPFFDLEFSLPQEEENDSKEQNDDVVVESLVTECQFVEEEENEEEEEEDELRFTLSSPGNSSIESNDQTTLPLSPSDDLFFKGKLVPIMDDTQQQPETANSSKPPAQQLSISLLKSATKLKVFNLGLKKSSKSLLTDTNNSNVNGSVTVTTTPKHEQEEKQHGTSKFFMVKFKVDDVVPIAASLFNSSRSSSCKQQKPPSVVVDDTSAETSVHNEEKIFSKEVVQKYLKKVKPLYIRVSKLKFHSGSQVNLGSGLKSTVVKEVEKEGISSNLPGGIKVACKRLGKSRSASSVTAAAAVVPTCHVQASSRRDDSLLQQEDGIQSAILHCKRSFNACRDSEGTLLPRSASDPSHEKTVKICQEVLQSSN